MTRTDGSPGQAAVATRSWDTTAPTRRFQSVLVGLGILALAPAVVATVHRVFPPTDDGPALLASFIPYGLLGYLVAAICFGIATARSRGGARGGRRATGALTAVSLAGLTAHLVWLAPLYVPDNRPAGDASFTVVSLNVQNAEARPDQLAAEASEADVVVLVEATPAWHERLSSAAWRDRFPYVVGSPLEGWNGAVIYSRFPLGQTTPLPPSSFQQWVATVEVPGIGPVRLVAVHPCNPYCGRNQWNSEHASLRAFLQQQDDARLLVAGDFNAVDDHGPLQALRSDGFRTAADVVGAGRLPTFPADSWVPPLLPIDHVLVNESLTATAVETFRVGGTDHLGLRTTVAATEG